MRKKSQNFAGFAAALLTWQPIYGRQGLPWMVKNAYKRWLSEVMLQQTQVPVVSEYFKRFIAAFPTLSSLAKASEEDVMRLWAGLGYYSRARNLLACAKKIEADFGGNFPKTREELMQLPGVGKSTAGAIASFSFDAATPILDGNVRRVFSRLIALKDPVDSASSLKTLWALAEELIPEKDAGTYNQALMDIGSGICTRTHPHCEKCPVCAWCEAHRLGKTEFYPVRTKKTPKPVRQKAMKLYLQGDALWVVKRTEKGVWRGLWSLPEFDSLEGLPVASFQHDFTHYRLQAKVYRETLPTRVNPEGPGKWLPWTEVESEALPSPIKRLLLRLACTV